MQEGVMIALGDERDVDGTRFSIYIKKLCVSKKQKNSMDSCLRRND
jgi:hypothetical protein